MAAQDAFIGRQLAIYRLERLLGRGGMASVYYGWDVKLQRPVAVKVFDARYQDDPTLARRFINEARTIAGWRHENIVQIYYAGDEAGLYYFAMEYIRGPDLRALLDRYRHAGELLPHADVVRIGHCVASALDYAHRHNVIHRDVKPSNVMLSDDGRVVLTDFGLAVNITQGTLGQVFGSPHYVAPEQARSSAQAVPQSDLYALGVMLYEMLTGAVPFDDPSPMSLALQHLTQAPPSPRQVNPALNPAVEEVLVKALSKSPLERYQTGTELIDALEDALSGRAQSPAGLIALPPPPAGTGAPERTLSHLDVAAAVKEYVHQHPQHPLGTPGASTTHMGQRKKGYGWLAAFVALPLLLAAFLLLAWWGGGFNFLRSSPVQPTAVVMNETPPAAATRTPAATAIAGATLAPPAAARSATPDEATAVVLERGELTATPDQALPTTPPDRGNLLILYYDDGAFYLYNRSKQEWPIFPLSIERLDASDAPIDRFEGRVWGDIYPKLRPGYCMVMRILQAKQELLPVECVGRILVLHQPRKDSGYLFWPAQPGSTHFRVLWNEVEVGRCEIAKGLCEVTLPD